MTSAKNQPFTKLKKDLKDKSGGSPQEQAIIDHITNTNTPRTSTSVVATRQSISGRYKVVLRFKGLFKNYSGKNGHHIKLTERLIDGSTCERILDDLDITLAYYLCDEAEKYIRVEFRGTIVVEGKGDITVDDTNCKFTS